MEFGIIDIVLIAITVLIMLIGLKRGIVKQLTGGITFISSIVITIFVYKYVANYILTSELFFNINEKFYGLVASNADADAINATIETAGVDGVKAVLSAMKIPGLVHNMFTKALAETIVSNPSMTVGDYVANAFSTKAIIIGSFILTFIASIIVVAILVHLLRKIADLPGIKVLDRLLGMVFSLVKWAVVVCVLLYLVTLVYKIPSIGDIVKTFMTTQLALDDDTQMSITKWIYLNNPIYTVMSKLSFNELLKGVTGGGEGSESAFAIIKIYF